MEVFVTYPETGLLTAGGGSGGCIDAGNGG